VKRGLLLLMELLVELGQKDCMDSKESLVPLVHKVPKECLARQGIKEGKGRRARMD
jgi:hypothetical protein